LSNLIDNYSYKTDIVEPISPFINGHIGFGYTGFDIAKGPDNKTGVVEPITPFINGKYIGSTISVLI
jgi:hypothetical protein